MEIIFIIAVIIGLVVFMKNDAQPDVEHFTVEQMMRYTKALQTRIEHLQAKQNKTDAVRAEIAQKEAQWQHAMSVWNRKNEEASK